MNKSRNRIENKINLKKTFLLALLALGLSLLGGCGLIDPKMYVEEDALMGKTKEEILQIVFAEDAPRVAAGHPNFSDEVNIAYAPPYTRHHKRQYASSDLYFKDIEDARAYRNFNQLMESDVWSICGRRGVFGDRRRHSWELTFKEGKVIKVRKEKVGDTNLYFR